MIDKFKILNNNLIKGSILNESGLNILKDIWNVKRIISLGKCKCDLENKCKDLNLEHIIITLPDLDNLQLPIDDTDEVIFINSDDFNDSDDAVSIMRDEIQAGYNPASDQANYPSEQQSWAPFLDVEVDHLNRPASLINSLEKLSQQRLGLSGLKLYKYTIPTQVYTSYWYTTLEAARSEGARDPNGKMYIASVSEDAKIQNLPNKDQTAIDNAILNDVDIIIFEGLSSAYVINFRTIGVQQMGTEDVNHIQVGMHDNYTGLAENVMPGTQGMMNGAGYVEIPFGNF